MAKQIGRGYLLSLVLMMLVSPRTFPRTPLDVQERAWLAQHPVVRYAVDPRWKPLEYLSDGRHDGLTRDYLDQLSSRTGIRFVLVPTRSWHESLDALASGQVDMLPGVPKFSADASPAPDTLYSQPYFTGQTLVVTQSDKPVVTTLEQLSGRTLAVHSGGIYERLLRARYPGISLMVFDDETAALDAVVGGRAYAAIDVDALIHPLLRQRYTGLHIAGVISDFPIVLRMAVRADLPLLQEVLARGLSSLSAGENDRIYSRWLEAADFGAPSLAALLHYYGPEIFLSTLLFAALLYAAWQSRRAELAANQSERQKSLFLAMMSHEIRNPMHTVLSSIELLDLALSGKEERALLAAANTASKQLFALLGDILDYSRLEARKLELIPKPTDPLRVVHDAIMQVDLAAQQKGLSMPLIAPSNLPHVMVDPVRLRQIVSNLLSNAVKFTSAGAVMTRVSLRVSTSEGEPARLGIEVRDTGPGMPTPVLEQLFTPFVQGSETTGGRQGGSGLGLSICQALVTMMGGRIEVQSRTGEGTTVRVTIPLQLAELPEVAPDVDSLTDRAQRFSTVRALVVEDEPLNQYILATQLSALGIPADVRGTGEAGLDAFREQDFTVVFLDCQLPGIDGYEMARQIRIHEESEGLSHALLVAISANGGPEHQQRCHKSGIDVVVSKPLGLEALGRVLAQHLGESLVQIDSGHREPKLPVSIFMDSVGADIRALQLALDEHDLARCETLAHRIKGAALIADNSEFVNAARTVEATAMSRNVLELQAHVANLWQLFDQLSDRENSRQQAASPSRRS